jgi:hypothetical protein
VADKLRNLFQAPKWLVRSFVPRVTIVEEKNQFLGRFPLIFNYVASPQRVDFHTVQPLPSPGLVSIVQR